MSFPGCVSPDSYQRDGRFKPDLLLHLTLWINLKAPHFRPINHHGATLCPASRSARPSILSDHNCFVKLPYNQPACASLVEYLRQFNFVLLFFTELLLKYYAKRLLELSVMESAPSDEEAAMLVDDSELTAESMGEICLNAACFISSV